MREVKKGYFRQVIYRRRDIMRYAEYLAKVVTYRKPEIAPALYEPTKRTRIEEYTASNKRKRNCYANDMAVIKPFIHIPYQSPYAQNYGSTIKFYRLYFQPLHP